MILNWLFDNSKLYLNYLIMQKIYIYLNDLIDMSNREQFQIQDTSSIKKWTKDARFIFKGEISKFQESTLDFGMINKIPNIAKVRVKEIVVPSKLFGNYYKDKEVTIQLSNNFEKPDVGQKIIFFTTLWLYGNDSIGVKEVGRLYENNVSNINESIYNIIKELDNEEIKNKINKSKLVLTGKVTNIEEIEIEDTGEEGEEEREHENEIFDVDKKIIRQANLKVDEVLKGNLIDNNVKILFDNNMNYSSYQSPKFNGNEYGVFFLSGSQEFQNKELFTAFNQGDFLSMKPESIDKVEQIKNIIRLEFNNSFDRGLNQ